MTEKIARQILLLRRPGGQDDATRRVKEALAVAAQTPPLAAEWRVQEASDHTAARELQSFQLSDAARSQIHDAATKLAARHCGSLLSVHNPATLAVGLGFLLLIAILVWFFFGQVGVFPDQAIKIAAAGSKAGPDQFEHVDVNAGALPDWFMLKGFDDFHVPPGLEDFAIVGARTFTVENETVAQAAVPENKMYFYSFAAEPFGISVTPESTWRITEANDTVLAIRQEDGVCFMVTFRGTKRDMRRILKGADKGSADKGSVL